MSWKPFAEIPEVGRIELMVPDFCTYFDIGYLPRAVALFESLQENSPGSRLFAVCMDSESYTTLVHLNLPGFVPVRREEFEDGDSELSSLAGSRTVVEYYFTCTSSVVLYVLRKNPEISLLFYVDADFWFFSSIDEMKLLFRFKIFKLANLLKTLLSIVCIKL